MSEFRKRESCKVICIRLVEDREGGLANFVILVLNFSDTRTTSASGGFGLWNGARGQGDVQNHTFSAEKRPKIGGRPSRYR